MATKSQASTVAEVDLLLFIFKHSLWITCWRSEWDGHAFRPWWGLGSRKIVRGGEHDSAACVGLSAHTVTSQCFSGENLSFVKRLT